MNYLRLLGALLTALCCALTGAAQSARFTGVAAVYSPIIGGNPNNRPFVSAYFGTTDPAGNSFYWLRYRGDFTLGGVLHPSPADTLIRQALVKLNPAGAQLWLREITDREGAAEGLDLATDAAGNVYALGRSCCWSGGNTIDGQPISGATATGFHAWVAKWAPGGAVQYVRAVAHSPNGPIHPRRLAVSSTGEMAATFNFERSAVVGTDTLRYPMRRHVVTRSGFIAKFSSAATPLWVRPMQDVDTLTWSVSMNLGFDAAGELYYIGAYGYYGGPGARTGVGGVALPPAGGRFRVKLGPAGQVRYARGLPVPSSDEQLAYVVAPDGTSYCGFSILHPATIAPGVTLRPSGRQSACVARYAANGDIDWVHQIGGRDSTDAVKIQPRMLTLSTNGAVLVGGSQHGRIYDGPVQLGQPYPVPLYPGHTWMMALNPENGGPLWGQALTSFRGEYCWQLLPHADGAVTLLAHTFADSIGLGNLAVMAPGNTNHKLLLASLSPHYNTLSGAAYLDANANNQQDATEGGFPGGLVVEVNPGNLPCSAPETTGRYNAYVDLNPSFSVSLPNPPRHYTVVAQGPATASFSTYGNVAAGRSFALQPIANQQDVQVILTLLSPARPGNLLNYQVQYRNVGTVAIAAGEVTLAHDTRLVFQSSTVAASATGSQSLTWTYAGLQPGETRRLNVIFRLPATAQLGSLVSSTATVAPLTGDLEPVDNTSTATRTVTGSYDPNDIEVNHVRLSTSQVASGEWLEYTVRFQNHGSDTAFSVLIVDSLSAARLQLSSLQILAASHNCAWSLSSAGRLLVSFPDILLPSQTTNMIASDGFVRFRVRPVGSLVAGDQIPNQAQIHFDYNVPMATNTALTTIESTLGASSGATDPAGVTVWPNPAGATLHVEVTRAEAGELTLTLLDALGRTVRTQAVTAATSLRRATLDVRGLPAGVYLLRGQGAGQPFARRVVLR